MLKIFSKLKLLFKFTKRDIFLFLSVACAIFILDLTTKHVVFSMKSQFVYVLPIFNILKVRNFGVSFGLFSENPETSFYFILIFDFFVMLYLLHCFQTKNEYKHPTLFIVGLNFVLGGAMGNFVDRIATGSVRDFLDVHIGNAHWPCFNVADIFVCLGVGIWIICEMFYRKKVKQSK